MPIAKTILEQVAIHLETIAHLKARNIFLEAAITVALEKLEALDENPRSETLLDEALFVLNQSIGRM